MKEVEREAPGFETLPWARLLGVKKALTSGVEVREPRALEGVEAGVELRLGESEDDPVLRDVSVPSRLEGVPNLTLDVAVVEGLGEVDVKGVLEACDTVAVLLLSPLSLPL